MNKIVFDIETTEIIPLGGNLNSLKIAVVGVYDYKRNEYKTYDESQLEELWELLRETESIIGFNSDHFDIPLLNNFAPFDLIKEFKSIDILKSIKESCGRRIKLDWIADATLGKTKIGKGTEAVTWWKQGKYDEVKKYCLEDVKITKELYEYILKNNKCMYKDLGTIHTIPIDTSTWKEERKNTNTSLF